MQIKFSASSGTENMVKLKNMMKFGRRTVASHNVAGLVPGYFHFEYKIKVEKIQAWGLILMLC